MSRNVESVGKKKCVIPPNYILVKEKPVSLGAEQQFVWLSEVNIKLGGENYLRKIARGLSC